LDFSGWNFRVRLKSSQKLEGELLATAEGAAIRVSSDFLYFKYRDNKISDKKN